MQIYTPNVRTMSNGSRTTATRENCKWLIFVDILFTQALTPPVRLPLYASMRRTMATPFVLLAQARHGLV